MDKVKFEEEAKKIIEEESKEVRDSLFEKEGTWLQHLKSWHCI